MHTAFEKLINAMGPSGFEDSPIAVFQSLIEPYCDNCVRDICGNLICSRITNNATKTVMLVSHSDEIGLIVTYIEESGYIRFSGIGGIDPQILIGRKVKIIHQNNIVIGVIGTLPIHMKRGVKNPEIEVSDLWIDIGTFNKTDTLNRVSIGDAIVFDGGYEQLTHSLFLSRAADDRVGLLILAMVMKAIVNIEIKANIVCVATRKEEIGGRGAITASYGINPDVSIGVDVCHGTDYPTANKAKFGDIVLGKGVVIPIGSDFDMAFQQELRKTSIKNNIKFQTNVIMGNSGTDINKVQVSRNGCVTGFLGIPCRYMHTPVEVVSWDDIMAAIELLKMYVTQSNSNYKSTQDPRSSKSGKNKK